jgi:transposase-like protein
MKQANHSNAKTNVHFRKLICNSKLTTRELSNQFNVSQNTISKWNNRTVFEDKSSRPHTINYTLSEIEKQLLINIRTATWWALDEIVEMVYPNDAKQLRSAVYRTFKSNGINTVPQKEKDKAKKFKEYDPGYLHLDVTYLPMLNGKKYYLYVVIDRATRTLYYKIYENKTAVNTKDFMLEVKDLFPFDITHILTDNGLEFTNKLLKSKKGKACEKPSLLDEFCTENNIEHRLTKPATPKTNGMVERVNKTIKNNTIKLNQYQNIDELELNLKKFLVTYNTIRRHSGVRKELNVKTPYQALEKWFEINPKIFNKNPIEFKNKIVNFKIIRHVVKQQPCET